MFCPRAVEWGTGADAANVAVGLLVAIATFSAVWVALKSSRRAEALARELRNAERDVELQREKATRGMLAVALDQELYMIFGEAQSAWLKLKAIADTNPKPDRIVRIPALPDKGFELLERFAPDFALFPPIVGADLLRTLALMMGIRNGPFGGGSVETAARDVSALQAAIDALLVCSRNARIGVRGFVPTDIQLGAIEPMPTGQPD